MALKDRQFVVCIDDGGYPASLEPRKIYEVLPDPEGEKHDQRRVIDESGEDYLYPESLFLDIQLPKRIADAIVSAA
jgi:hypothetical protein